MASTSSYFSFRNIFFNFTTCLKAKVFNGIWSLSGIVLFYVSGFILPIKFLSSPSLSENICSCYNTPPLFDAAEKPTAKTNLTSLTCSISSRLLENIERCLCVRPAVFDLLQRFTASLAISADFHNDSLGDLLHTCSCWSQENQMSRRSALSKILSKYLNLMSFSVLSWNDGDGNKNSSDGATYFIRRDGNMWTPRSTLIVTRFRSNHKSCNRGQSGIKRERSEGLILDILFQFSYLH